jgi:hypothetical protein
VPLQPDSQINRSNTRGFHDTRVLFFSPETGYTFLPTEKIIKPGFSFVDWRRNSLNDHIPEAAM